MLKNVSGMTLVEVMIAATLMVVVALGLAQLIQSTNRADRENKFKQDIFTSREQQRYEEKVIPLPSPTP